jgi:acyl-CoA synthetase (AMP-forming)/AMP-acid ligase II
MTTNTLPVPDPVHWFALGDLARENRRKFPTHTAVVCGEVRLTYAELDVRTTKLANALRHAGVTTGDRVVWLGQICHSGLELLLAAAKLGAILAPVNWRLSAEEMAFVLDDLDPSIVFWQDAEVGDSVRAGRQLARDGAEWVQVDSDGADSYEALLASGSHQDDDAPVDPMSPVLIIYTAAFEGLPAGALLHHSGLLMTAMVRAHFAEVSCNTVYLNATNLYHVGNWDFGTLPTLLLGGTNVFMRRWDAAEAAQLTDREKVTMAFMAGPMYEALRGEAERQGKDISSLHPPDFIGQRIGGYGQTEIHGVQMFRAYGDCDGAHGRPSPFAQVRLIDEAGQEVSPGEIGEIAVRGPVVMTGYRNRPERNAEAMAKGWRRTNDLGRRESDGSVSFIGPKQRMLKSGAENIYPVEVERAVETHPDVCRCAVIGVPDERWEQSVCAIVELIPGRTLTAQDVIDHCRTCLASYKKPRRVEFVDSLPTSAAGRIDYEVLDARFGGGGYPGVR